MSNVIAFTGNLGKDAELKEVGGSQVLNFSVANSVGFGDRKQTLWMGCAIWGKQATALEQYMKKGTKVFVSGELSTREYNEKTYLEVRVNSVDFCGSKSDGESSQSAPVPAPAPAPAAQEQGGSEDLPF